MQSGNEDVECVNPLAGQYTQILLGFPHLTSVCALPSV